MVEIEVKGHSGCQIDVVKDNDMVYVYKSTADPKYLQRLALQAKKQQAASERMSQHVRIPKIYEVQENTDTTVVKMQYVYSKNFIEFFEQGGFEQLDYLIDALKNFIEEEIDKSELKTIPPTIFQDKFVQIRNVVEEKLLCCEKDLDRFQIQDKKLKSQIQVIIGRSQKVFDGLKEMLIPVGICHGDLTFSNILFNGSNCYLIDFLDSFIETPLQDIVKIRQDTAFRWSQLMYTKEFDEVRLRIICDKIDREINNYFTRKYQWYTDHYRTLQLMNFLRILPYAHEERVINYLVDVLGGLLDEIDMKYSEIKIKEECRSKSCTLNNKRTLIMPIAANKPEYAYRLPRIFQMAEDGTMHCIKALQSLDLTKFDHIFITILHSLDDRYSLSEMLELQFRIRGIKNAKIVVLDELTSSQPETIYQTIRKMNIRGSIFVKDADCSFIGDDINGNSIVIYPLEQLDWVNPKNKSYVNIDDMYYITNVIEKRIVSRYFTAGGYCFESSEDYCLYYERIKGMHNLYLSHIIYSMLLDKHTFRPVIAKEYDDFEFRF